MVYGAIVAKFCSRSQGQPVFGVRRAAMISISRAMSLEGFKSGYALKECREDELEA